MWASAATSKLRVEFLALAAAGHIGRIAVGNHARRDRISCVWHQSIALHWAV
jgi:hypothetical protein